MSLLSTRDPLQTQRFRFKNLERGWVVIKKLIAAASSVAGTIAATGNVLADEINLNPYSVNVAEPGAILSFVIKAIIFAAFLIAFIWLLIGGIKWILSSGDPGKVNAARQQVIHALVGLVVVVLALALIMLVQAILGVSIITGDNFTIPTLGN